MNVGIYHPVFGMQPLSIVLLVICIGIFLRLMLYRKRYARHKVSMSVVAYLLIVAYGWMAIRIVTSRYASIIDPSELAVHMSVLFAVIRARGNIARFLLIQQSQEKKC